MLHSSGSARQVKCKTAASWVQEYSHDSGVSYQIQTKLDNTRFPQSRGVRLLESVALQRCKCCNRRGSALSKYRKDSWLIFLRKGTERFSAVLLCQRIWAHEWPMSRIGIYLHSASHRSSIRDLGILPLLLGWFENKVFPRDSCCLVVGSSSVKFIPCGDLTIRLELEF